MEPRRSWYEHPSKVSLPQVCGSRLSSELRGLGMGLISVTIEPAGDLGEEGELLIRGVGEGGWQFFWVGENSPKHLAEIRAEIKKLGLPYLDLITGDAWHPHAKVGGHSTPKLREEQGPNQSDPAAAAKNANPMICPFDPADYNSAAAIR